MISMKKKISPATLVYFISSCSSPPFPSFLSCVFGLTCLLDLLHKISSVSILWGSLYTRGGGVGNGILGGGVLKKEEEEVMVICLMLGFS